MKALQLSQYKRLEVVELPVPQLLDDEVLVKVASCGICGSDIHGWDGSSGRRKPPLVMGHEAAGTVESVGSNVDSFSPGDRVTFDSTISCGQCVHCQCGKMNLCSNRQVLGVSCDEFRCNGAFAEFVKVPARICYGLPDDLSFDHAALVESVSIAVHAANRTSIPLGGTGVVIGSGMIGLLVVQAIQLAGCANVIAVDLDESKLNLATQLGATHAINAKPGDVTNQINELTNGIGADCVIEVVGATDTIQLAIESVKRGGCVTLVGNISPTVEIPLQKVVTKEIDLRGSCASNGEYPECIRLMSSGAIQVGPLITGQSSLEDGHEWFERLYAGNESHMKVIIHPGQSSKCY